MVTKEREIEILWEEYYHHKSEMLKYHKLLCYAEAKITEAPVFQKFEDNDE